MVTTISPEVLSRMGTAFNRFRQRMIASNRAYLHDIAQIIEELNLSETEAVPYVCKVLPTVFLYKFDSPRRVREGIPVSDLDALSKEVNDYIREEEGYGGDDDFEPSPLPEEYMALLHYCDSIQDPDLRVINPGGLFGTWLIWPKYEKEGFFENNCVDNALTECGVADPFDGWEYKTAFTIDATDLIGCAYGYSRRRRHFTPRPGRPAPRPLAEHECEWKWRIFYDGFSQTETKKVFNTLPEYLDWLAGWYDREVHGDLKMATKQVDHPPFLEGVSDAFDTTWRDLDSQKHKQQQNGLT